MPCSSEGECPNICLQETGQSLSLSQYERENGAEVYPKQSSLERCF